MIFGSTSRMYRQKTKSLAGNQASGHVESTGIMGNAEGMQVSFVHREKFQCIKAMKATCAGNQAAEPVQGTFTGLQDIRGITCARNKAVKRCTGNVLRKYTSMLVGNIQDLLNRTGDFTCRESARVMTGTHDKRSTSSTTRTEAELAGETNAKNSEMGIMFFSVDNR